MLKICQRVDVNIFVNNVSMTDTKYIHNCLIYIMQYIH